MSDLTPAPRGYPIKLVRDNTETIINSSGKPGELFYGPCPEGEHLLWLRKKLAEEVAEYLLEPGLRELTDVLAVLEALAEHEGSDLDSLRAELATSDRGGFSWTVMMFGRHPEYDDPQGR